MTARDPRNLCDVRTAPHRRRGGRGLGQRLRPRMHDALEPSVRCVTSISACHVRRRCAPSCPHPRWMARISGARPTRRRQDWPDSAQSDPARSLHRHRRARCSAGSRRIARRRLVVDASARVTPERPLVRTIGLVSRRIRRSALPLRTSLGTRRAPANDTRAPDNRCRGGPTDPDETTGASCIPSRPFLHVGTVTERSDANHCRRPSGLDAAMMTTSDWIPEKTTTSEAVGRPRCRSSGTPGPRMVEARVRRQLT